MFDLKVGLENSLFRSELRLELHIVTQNVCEAIGVGRDAHNLNMYF